MKNVGEDKMRSPFVKNQSGASVRGWVGVILDSPKFGVASLAIQGFEASYREMGAAQLLKGLMWLVLRRFLNLGLVRSKGCNARILLSRETEHRQLNTVRVSAIRP